MESFHEARRLARINATFLPACQPLRTLHVGSDSTHSFVTHQNRLDPSRPTKLCRTYLLCGCKASSLTQGLERYIHLLADPAHFWLIHPRAVLVTNTNGKPVGAWATFRPRVPITRLGQHARRSTGAPLVIDPIPQAPPARNLDELFESLFE